jgi:ribonuclease Z
MSAQRPDQLPEMAHQGGRLPLSYRPVSGNPVEPYPETFVPGEEQLRTGEMRVTILGSGDPNLSRAQASGSVLVEVGNDEKDFFLFDVGSGSMANWKSLLLPLAGTTKVFLSHLHADHVGDLPTLLGSFAKLGRLDPVEIWGGASDDPDLGHATFIEHMTKALRWDTASVAGFNASTGNEAIAHEIPYDSVEVAYERNGVKITSFPVIHALNGALGYSIEFAGRRVVFSGDTTPCRHVVDAAAEGCDLLIHECYLSPTIVATAMKRPVEEVTALLKQAHTLPDQAGKVFTMANPRMGALWHHPLTPAVGQVLADVSENFAGPLVVSQDLTVFNVTPEAVVARQAAVNDLPPTVPGVSKTDKKIDPPNPEPTWWADARLEL